MHPETAMEPGTDHERELMAALATERAKNEELEMRLAVLRKNRDEANRSRNEETKKSRHLQEELNRFSARLRSKGLSFFKSSLMCRHLRALPDWDP